MNKIKHRTFTTSYSLEKRKKNFSCFIREYHHRPRLVKYCGNGEKLYNIKIKESKKNLILRKISFCIN